VDAGASLSKLGPVLACFCLRPIAASTDRRELFKASTEAFLFPKLSLHSGSSNNVKYYILGTQKVRLKISPSTTFPFSPPRRWRTFRVIGCTSTANGAAKARWGISSAVAAAKAGDVGEFVVRDAESCENYFFRAENFVK